MAIPEVYKQKDSWPHTFSKDSPEYMGENGRKWQDMVCVHCHQRYIHNKEARPTGVCPARKDKSEMRRILG